MSRLNSEAARIDDAQMFRARAQVHRITSTAQLIPNHGTVMLISSSTGTPRWDIQTPVPGARLRITKDSTSTGLWTVQGTSGTTNGATFNKSGNTIITFDALDDNVELEGITATEWATVVNNNAAFS